MFESEFCGRSSGLETHHAILAQNPYDLVGARQVGPSGPTQGSCSIFNSLLELTESAFLAGQAVDVDGVVFPLFLVRSAKEQVVDVRVGHGRNVGVHRFDVYHGCEMVGMEVR